MIPRYALPRMTSIWEPQSRYAAWLRIELLACEAWVELGVVPREALAVIQERAGYDLGRIQEIEREVRHDVIAFVSAVAEQVGPEARYLHFGLTSYDVVDTALAYSFSRLPIFYWKIWKHSRWCLPILPDAISERSWLGGRMGFMPSR